MKSFRNTIWAPQISILVAGIMVFLMLPCLPACESNNMVQPKQELSIFEQPEVLSSLEADAKVIRDNIGQIHNYVLKRFYDKKPGLPGGEKIAKEDFRRFLLSSLNEEFQTRGLQVRLSEVDLDKIVEEMTRFMKDTGIDFCNPENINPLEALDMLASKGYITEEDVRHCKHITKCLEEGTPYKDRNHLTASKISDEAEIYEDVITESYPLWMAELQQLYPDIDLAWWYSLIRKIGPYVADALGAIVGAGMGGAIGAIVGAALASIAFEVITWLGDMGYL